MTSDSEAGGVRAIAAKAERDMFIANQRLGAAIADYHADVVACDEPRVADDIQRIHAAIDLQLAAIRLKLSLQWLMGSEPLGGEGRLQ